MALGKLGQNFLLRRRSFKNIWDAHFCILKLGGD